MAREADLDIRATFLVRVGRLLAGKQEDWFVRPTGVAAAKGRIFVTDPGAGQFWILSPAQRSVLRIDRSGDRKLRSPIGVCPGPGNDIYLTDSAQGNIYRYNGETGALVSELPGNFQRPTGVAYDKINDRLYVADSARHVVIVMSGDGSLKSELGKRGVGDGEFNFPTFLFVDGEGVLLVTDSMGFRIQRFNPNGAFLGRIGYHGNVEGDFARPKGVATDSQGHVYVVDALFHTVQIFDIEGNYLAHFGTQGREEGEFWLPVGIYIDHKDRIYVADSYNARIQIFQFMPGNADEP